VKDLLMLKPLKNKRFFTAFRMTVTL